MASHSCAMALCSHFRNLTDEQFAEIANRRGLVGVNLYTPFLVRQSDSVIDDAIDHIERFIGILIEHCAGALPLWLAPVQVAVIPIADRHKEAAAEFAGELKAVGGRVEVMDQNEPMKVKIAKAQSQKIPYMIVMGDKEGEEKLVSVRERSEGDLGQWDRQKFIDVIRDAAI